MFTKEEKKLLEYLLKQHLEEIEEVEDLPNQELKLLAAEMKYDDFVRRIIKKLY